jgi:CheY-like chemotaxis protein
MSRTAGVDGIVCHIPGFCGDPGTDLNKHRGRGESIVIRQFFLALDGIGFAAYLSMSWQIHNFAKDSRTNRELTVLIVEDEILSRHALVSLLHAGGYDVIAAESGEEGLKLAGKTRGRVFALVDFSLPGMDGLSLIEKLRVIDRDIAAILMTAEDQREIVAKAYNDSVTYMRKPIEIARVFEILSKQTPVHM